MDTCMRRPMGVCGAFTLEVVRHLTWQQSHVNAAEGACGGGDRKQRGWIEAGNDKTTSCCIS